MRLPLLLTLLCATTAAAQDWSASFPPAALASQLDVRPAAVLVAGVNPEARPAAQALEAALGASGDVRLVMDDSALGNLEGLSDVQIVERCKGLPVDRVMVVRVFPRGDGPASAVVSLYDLGGRRMAGFAAEAGQPLQARAADSPPSAPAPDEPSEPSEPGHQSPQELYEERYIGV